MTEKILRQSREAESALADALSPGSPELTYPDPIEGFLSNLEMGYSNHMSNQHIKSPRKRSTGPFEGLGFGDNSDESETSSLCSEKSFDYGRGRPSDLGVWLGSRERLYGQNWDTVAIQVAKLSLA